MQSPSELCPIAHEKKKECAVLLPCEGDVRTAQYRTVVAGITKEEEEEEEEEEKMVIGRRAECAREK